MLSIMSLLYFFVPISTSTFHKYTYIVTRLLTYWVVKIHAYLSFIILSQQFDPSTLFIYLTFISLVRTIITIDIYTFILFKHSSTFIYNLTDLQRHLIRCARVNRIYAVCCGHRRLAAKP